MKLILLITLFLGLNAEEFTVKYNDLQSIDKLVCLDGKLHILVEIDDVQQPLQIFKTEQDEFGNNIPVLCQNQNKGNRWKLTEEKID